MTMQDKNSNIQSDSQLREALHQKQGLSNADSKEKMSAAAAAAKQPKSQKSQ